MTANWLDIMFSIYKCTRFQSAPKESHLTAVKWIICYIIWTQDIGLWYPYSSNLDLIGYSYANFASDKDDQKSISETCQIFENALISWHNKNQTPVALSTTKGEYIAIDDCGTQISYIMHQLLDFDLSLESVPIMCNNTNALVYPNIFCIILGLSISILNNILFMTISKEVILC